MQIWKLVLDPKNPQLTIEQVANHAWKLDYPLFNFKGTIYKLVPPPPDSSDVKWEETPSRAEMFEQPDIFCVMDEKQERIAMNDFGPVLFSNPLYAKLFAETVKGVPKLFHEAIFLQREARKNGSKLIVPEEKKLIVPAR